MQPGIGALTGMGVPTLGNNLRKWHGTLVSNKKSHGGHDIDMTYHQSEYHTEPYKITRHD